MDNDWKVVSDVCIRHIWTGSDGGQVDVSPDWYEQNGNPIDPETGADMTYSHTEIRPWALGVGKAEPGA